METKGPTEESVGMKGNAPPDVITVDKSGESSSSVNTASQARTPKHANKGKDDGQHHAPQHPPTVAGHHLPPPHPSTLTSDNKNLEGPPVQTWNGPNHYPPFHPPPRGAYQAEPIYHHGGTPQQVSPGSGRYYYRPPPQFYEQQPPPPPPQRYNEYPPRYYGYEGPRWATYRPPDNEPTAASSFQRNANFHRAVSNSFDRSIKSNVEKQSIPDVASVDGDASWGALKQVHSVDEEEMRKRLSKRKSKDVVMHEPNSNSSSLTNSPTEGVVSGTAKKPKTTSALDDTALLSEKMDKLPPPSPDGSAPSLDLVKCPSGTSALLLPEHQRSLSQFSLTGIEKEKDKKKQSPLSITCSPPVSPKVKKDKQQQQPKVHQPQPVYPKNSSPGFYEKSYSYDAQRPSSSSSSTITPMNVVAEHHQQDMRGQPPTVGQVPSWEINAQDSFGATSTGLMGAFSFPQESYGMIHQSASAEMMQHHMVDSRNPPMESRNQSFDYQQHNGNNFRDMYEGQRMSFDGRYQGSFPPQAPSWGSAGSYNPYSNPPPPPPVGRNHPYNMMRNYSEDSGRASPPRMNYPPPPEFHVPPSMVSKAPPGQQQTLMTSPYTDSPKIGPFGWSKEEDKRLTDIMKKYKNARDWEPIAKELNRGRTAKECHERWIRYLKPGVRKGQWTDHEDAIVMEVVENSSEQPFTRWSDLAQRLPGRVGKQIRDRWVNHLNPAIDHMPFSREDDLRLWEGHKKLGKRWVEISTKFFNNRRSENHIKNRWYSATFKKFISNEFGPEAYNSDKSVSTPTNGSSSNNSGSNNKKKSSRNSAVDPEMEAV